MTTPPNIIPRNVNNLKNIDKRLSMIETNIGAPTAPLNVINNINQNKNNQKNVAISNFIDKFKSEFQLKNIENDFGKCIDFTITFVENHVSEFESIIEETLTGQFKIQLVIDLLDQVLEKIPLVGPELETIINQFINLKNPSTVVNIPVEISKKKTKCTIV